MQVVSIFIAIIGIASRLVVAQSQSGYNYPSPFNQLTPGATGDLGGVPNAQQPTSFTGPPPGYSNPQFTPAGPPSFGATPTLTPGFNQPQFVPTTSSLPSSGVPSHSNIPSHSSVPSHSSISSHSSIPSIPSGGFVAPSQSGFPSTSAPSSKGFDSGGFPLSGGHSSGGHSSGSHSGTGIATTPFQSPSAFPGSSVDSTGFGAPGFTQGQQSFGGQANNFGPSGGSTQFQGENDGSYPGGDYSAIPGTPGVDYPVYTEIPKTSFDCKNQQFPGYYADVEAQCQVFHICALNTTFDFLCPNGTIFSQEHLVCVWWNQFDCNSAPSLYGNNAYIYDYSKTGQSRDNQGPSQNFGNTAVGNGFDGAQSPGFVQGGSPNFGVTQQPGFSPPGFGVQSPSAPSGFGPTSAAAAPSFTSPSFGSTQAGATGFGSTQSGAPGFGSTHSSVPATGFGQPAPAHSSGFGQAHIPSSGSSHTSSHNIPSSHSFPSSQSGADQYPIVPPSQPDYQQPSVITPTISSSPAPFVGPTGYPAAGLPTPINTALGEQPSPSREYLPSRRTK